MNLTIINHQGKLALDYGSHPDRELPIRHKSLLVSDIPVADYPDLIGCSLTGAGEIYRAWPRGREVRIVTDASWRHETVDEPVSAPRNGSTYTWAWRGWFGEWRKEPFGTCEECRKVHDPAIPRCQACGACHRPSIKIVYCEQCYHCHKGQCA